MRCNVDFDEWLKEELVMYAREQRESFFARRYGQFQEARAERGRLIWPDAKGTSGFT